MGSGDSLCDGGEGRIGFAIEPIAVVEYLDLVGPAIPLADEMGAGRNGPYGSAGAWCLVRHGSQSAPGCGRKPAMGPALTFVQENTAQENARERAWRSSPKGLLPDPPQASEVQNDVPANPCILRHHRTFALVLDKVQSNEGFPGAKFTARSSPRSRFEPAVRTPGGPVARHPQPRGRKPALRREIPSILRGFQGRLSC